MSQRFKVSSLLSRSVKSAGLQLCPHFILIMLSPFIPALMREAWPNNILKASLTFKVGLKFYWQVNKRSDNWDLIVSATSATAAVATARQHHISGCCCGDSCVVAALFNSNRSSQCKYPTVRGQNTRNDPIMDNHWCNNSSCKNSVKYLCFFYNEFTLMGHWTQHRQSSEDWFIDSSSQNIMSASGLRPRDTEKCYHQTKQRIISTSTETHG